MSKINEIKKQTRKEKRGKVIKIPEAKRQKELEAKEKERKAENKSSTLQGGC